MPKARNISEMDSQQPNNGDGHIHKFNQREDSYKLAYEAGLASGKEEGYRRGYREGFADCIKFVNPALGESEARNTSTCGMRESGSHRASRLRGMPCAECGCPSYSDEVQCSRCGTQKANVVGKQVAATEEQ